MADDSPVIFFDDDLPMAFRTLGDAAGYLEVIDVENGEYADASAFTPDGRIIDVRAVGDDVVMTITDRRDVVGLPDLLRTAAEDGLIRSSPEEPGEVVTELLCMQWAARWPKWPRWLDRRFNGEPPGR